MPSSSFHPQPADLHSTPIYNELAALGGIVEGAHIRFGEWPVQILTDANELIAEAIQEAQPVAFDDVPTRAFRAEHLCAITTSRKNKRPIPPDNVPRAGGSRSKQTRRLAWALRLAGKRLGACPHIFGETPRMQIDPKKTAYNAETSEQMHRFLQSKSWEEKVRSIERMRAATKRAREAMSRQGADTAPNLRDNPPSG